MKQSSTMNEGQRSYLQAASAARKLQSDLINLVDENLLATWEDAIGCSEASEEILKLLEGLDPKFRASVSAINLIETLRKVCLLAEYSYLLRVDIDEDPQIRDESS